MKELVVFSALLISSCLGFYLPGIAPVSYCTTDEINKDCKFNIPIFVNRLVSSESILPYEYTAFDFCEANTVDGISPAPSENLGQVLFGERIRPSAYKLQFGKDVSCAKVCTKSYESKENKDLEFLKHGMMLSYENKWIVDNLPLAWCYETAGDEHYCSTGFPIGCYVDVNGIQEDACVIDSARYQAKNSYYVFNHVLRPL